MTDEETECDGECEDPYCDKREEYEVEFSVIVKGTVMAHSEEEADELASAASMDISSEVPDTFGEEWTETPDFFGVDYTLDSAGMQAARAAETAAYMARVGAE